MKENYEPQNKVEMGRRDFLRGSATTGVGVLLASKAARAQKTARAEAGGAPDDINIALIGAGAQGMVLMDAILRIPGIRFKAVCDIWEYSQRRGSRTLKAYGHDVNVYEDFREMLSSETDLDAAIVATPDWVHAEHSIACMEAGLDVYCEKEMSNSLEEARRMVESARNTGRLLQIGHQRRSNPRYHHAIDRLLLNRGLCGRMTHANAQWNRAKSDDLGWPPKYEIPRAKLDQFGYESMHQFRNWRWYRRYGGGPIVDLGSHQIDIFSWVFQSNPKSVMASGGIDFYEHHEWYDNVMATFEYDTPHGTKRAFYQVLTTTSYNGFYEAFMGEDGTLVISEVPDRGNHFLKENHVDEAQWAKLAQEGLLAKVETEAVSIEKDDDLMVDVRVSPILGSWEIPVSLSKPVHQPHLENFFDAMRYGTPLTCPAEVGYETAVSVLKVNEAVAAGRTLEFHPEEFEV